VVEVVRIYVPVGNKRFGDAEYSCESFTSLHLEDAVSEQSCTQRVALDVGAVAGFRARYSYKSSAAVARWTHPEHVASRSTDGRTTLTAPAHNYTFASVAHAGGRSTEYS